MDCGSSRARTIYVSPAYERLWKRKADALYRRFDTWKEAIHPDDRERVQRAFFGRFQGGRYEIEYRVVRPDGSRVWIRDRCFPIDDEAGQLVRVAGIAEDITGRKDTERMLQQWADAFKYCAHGIVMGNPTSRPSWSATRRSRACSSGSPARCRGCCSARYSASRSLPARTWVFRADHEGPLLRVLDAQGGRSWLPVQVDVMTRAGMPTEPSSIGRYAQDAGDAQACREEASNSERAPPERDGGGRPGGVGMGQSQRDALGKSAAETHVGTGLPGPGIFQAELVGNRIHESDREALAQASSARCPKARPSSRVSDAACGWVDPLVRLARTTGNGRSRGAVSG